MLYIIFQARKVSTAAAAFVRWSRAVYNYGTNYKAKADEIRQMLDSKSENVKKQVNSILSSLSYT